MGKMKGNRLNTAANVGSFVTGRQQLKQQRAIAGSTAAALQIQQNMLEIQQQQAYEADYERLLSRTDRAVAAGRMTRAAADYDLLVARTDRAVAVGRMTPDEAFHELLVARTDLAVAEGRMTPEEADSHVELESYNHRNPAPKPGTRVTRSFGAMLTASLSPATAGWYFKDAAARRWDGRKWTLETMPAAAAKEIARHEWQSVTAEGRVQKSRMTAGILGILLGFVGIHRFYLGDKGWGVLQATVFVMLASVTFGLVGLWGLIEGIMILGKAKTFSRDASGVPLK